MGTLIHFTLNTLHYLFIPVLKPFYITHRVVTLSPPSPKDGNYLCHWPICHNHVVYRCTMNQNQPSPGCWTCMSYLSLSGLHRLGCLCVFLTHAPRRKQREAKLLESRNVGCVTMNFFPHKNINISTDSSCDGTVHVLNTSLYSIHFFRNITKDG